MPLRMRTLAFTLSVNQKRAQMTTNQKIVLKLQALYYKRNKKSTNIDNTFLKQIAISIRLDIPKKSRYRYDSIYRNSTNYYY